MAAPVIDAPSRRTLLCMTMAACALSARAAGVSRLRVGFVNPGRRSDRFWQMVDLVMRTAARQFNIDLITDWAERDRQAIITQAQAIIDQKPDYLLVVNEHRTLLPVLGMAMAAGIPSLIVFSGMAAEDEAALGRPRERSPLLLGSLLPDNRGAGNLMARSLLAACRRCRPTGKDGPVQVLALGGIVATPAGWERSEGLRAALAEDGDAVLLDHVPLNWSRDEARERTLSLLRRQPQAEGIWCANDDMALGAMEAAVTLGRQPGKDLCLVGMNWQEEALRTVVDGRLHLSVGGHFLLGAWALAWLRDHADGLDFAAAGGVSQSLTLAALERDQINPYLARFGGDGWGRADFRRFRQRHGSYDLNVGPLLTG